MINMLFHTWVTWYHDQIRLINKLRSVWIYEQQIHAHRTVHHLVWQTPTLSDSLWFVMIAILTPTEVDSSVGNFSINLLPAFSSVAFNGLTRHTTLILHSSAMLQSMIMNNQIHRRAKTLGLWKDRSCSETKLATSSSVWRNVNQKKMHRAPKVARTL